MPAVAKSVRQRLFHEKESGMEGKIDLWGVMRSANYCEFVMDLEENTFCTRVSPRRPPWHSRVTVRERTWRKELSAAQVRHRGGKDDEMVVAFPELLLPAIHATTSPSCSRRSRPAPAGHHSVQLQPITSPTYCSRYSNIQQSWPP